MAETKRPGQSVRQYNRSHTKRTVPKDGEVRYRSVIQILYRDRPTEERHGQQDWGNLNRAIAAAFIAAGHYVMKDDTIAGLRLGVASQDGTMIRDLGEIQLRRWYQP